MNLDTILLQLRKEYVATLPEKIQTIRHFFNSGDALGCKEVFHKLKGTGATYGIPEISEIGEALEAYVKSHPNDLKSAVPDALELLNQVHLHRLQDKPFAPATDTRFIRIKSRLG